MKGTFDLLPESCRSTFERRARLRVWTWACIWAAVGVAGLGSWARHDLSSWEDRRDELADRVRTHWQRNDRAVALIGEIRELESAVTRYRRLAWPVRSSDVVGVLAGLAPRPVTLTSLTLAPRDARAARSGEERGSPVLVVELDGVATDDLAVARFVSGLEEHALFKTVAMDFARSHEVDGSAARQFRLRCEVDLSNRYRFVPPSGGDHAEATP